MSRDEQIIVVASALERFDIPESTKVAANLVDFGIGTKGRFELVDVTHKEQLVLGPKGFSVEISPIDYGQKKKEEQKEEQTTEVEETQMKVEEASGIQSFMTPESSNIHSVHYDALKELLEVTFKGGGVYRYLAVPASAFKGMLTAESKGKYFNAEIKSRYSYEKVR